MNPLKLLITTCVISLLFACAHSPQSVKLNPTIDTGTMIVGDGEAMMVGFVDLMEGKPIGSRGGVYGESSMMTLDPNYQKNIHVQLKKGFASLGFNSWVKEAAQSDIQTIVTLSNLTFNRVKGNLFNTYEVDVTFEVQVVKGNKIYKNLYAEKGEQKYPKNPDGVAVGIHMNKLISAVVERLLADEALHRFLKSD